jgi:RNA polymerase sigma factor for flagellar operon FliA
VSKDVDSPDVIERFNAHLELVDRIATQLRRTLASSIDRDELMSAGREGLLDAARRFDAERGVPFGAYATLRIRGAMIDGVRRLATLPRRTWERLRAVEAAQLISESTAEDVFGGRAPGAGPAEAEAALNEHLATMATAMALGMLTDSRSSTDDAPNHENPEEATLRHELVSLVRAAVDNLPEPEGELVRRHYFGGERFDVVAAELGLSKSWASRLHTRAVKRLSNRLSGSR